MDKYEYKVRSEEIKELIAQKEYVRAAEIADSIDWRRVKSVMMLCTISDLYKINRRYEDSYDLLMLAYERQPGSRTIVYALGELSVKMGNITQAWEYYKEYMQIAPKDAGRYILQYKIYEAEEVNLEERVAVLEELKVREYRERWAYELAYLYHRIGLASKCVDECDEMIAFFGDGRYVVKALELKMLHEPLTQEQQVKYNNRFAAREEAVVENVVVEAVEQEPVPQATTTWSGTRVAKADGNTEIEFAATKRMPVEEIDIQVKPINTGLDGTMDLQKEVAAGLQAVLGDKDKELEDKITRSIIAPMLETDNIDSQSVESGVNAETEESVAEAVEETVEAAYENVSETTEAVQKNGEAVQKAAEETVEAVIENAQEATETVTETVEETAEVTEEAVREAAESVTEGGQEVVETAGVDKTAETVMEQLRRESMAETPKEMATVISMDGDGQLSFIVPEKTMIEKQITGQISFVDVMAEWERRKKELEAKNEEKIRQLVKKDTHQMFDDFEIAKRDGLLEQLENGRDLDSVIAEAEGRYVDEDGIPVPPSLVEDEGEEGFVEDYEEISVLEARAAVELTEEQDEARETEAETYEEEAVQDSASENYDGELQQAVEQVYEEELLSAVEDTWERQSETEAETCEDEVVQETEPEIYEEQEPKNDNCEQQESSEEQDIEEIVEAVLTQEDEVEELVEIEDLTEQEAEAATDTAEESYSEQEQPDEASQDDLGESEEVLSEIDAAYEAALMGATVDEKEGREAGIDYETISMPGSEVEAALQQAAEKQRNLTREERELFGPYIQGRSSKVQLVHAIDNISMAAYTGNVVITGAEGLDTLGLAKNIIRNIQLTDSNFSGKIAKISGESLNKRDVTAVLEGLDNGALIIQKAAAMNRKTVDSLHKALQQEHMGIVVILEGTKKAMNGFLEKHEKLQTCFTGRIDMEALSDAALVNFGKKYAREKEYSIDELGALALSRKIGERQTNDHAVTIMEVKEIVDAAIESANRKSIGHFFDILMAKRYDDEDMIIIKEKDFR